MIDEKLYRETFSRLRASDEAKKEVLLKMNEMNEKKTVRRPLKALRALALAAVLALALAVTANAASGGELFRNLRIIWQDESQIILEDDQGNQVLVTGVYADAELRDGKLMLTVNDEEFDITRDIEEIGTYNTTVECAGGQAAAVRVTGSLEDWEIETSLEDGNASGSTNGDTKSAASYSTYTTTTVVTSGG